MNALNNFVGKKISKKSLAQKSIYFEQKTLKESVGSQDQIAASYGGFNKIIFKPGGNFIVQPINLKKDKCIELNKNLLLVYTGIKRTAHDIAKGYINKLQKTKKNHILEIESFAREGEKILKNGNTSIVESGVGRIIEVDKKGNIVHEIPMKRDGRQNTRWVRFTPEGNYLVTSENPGIVTEYNRKGEIVWEYLISTR